MHVSMVVSGVVDLSGSHGTLRAGAGELVVVPAGHHGLVRAVQEADSLVVMLDEAFVLGVLGWTMPTGGLHRAWRPGERSAMYRVRLSPQAVAAFERRFTKTVATIRTRTPLRAMSAALGLLSRVEPLMAGDDELVISRPMPLRPEVEQARRLMTDEYASAWTVPELADRVGLSASALTRAFRAGLGVSPAAYLRQVRLGRFASLVAGTSLGVAEAAWRVGWSSPSQARALTIRQYGVSPSVLRRRAQPDPSE